MDLFGSNFRNFKISKNLEKKGKYLVFFLNYEIRDPKNHEISRIRERDEIHLWYIWMRMFMSDSPRLEKPEPGFDWKLHDIRISKNRFLYINIKIEMEKERNFRKIEVWAKFWHLVTFLLKNFILSSVHFSRVNRDRNRSRDSKKPIKSRPGSRWNTNIYTTRFQGISEAVRRRLRLLEFKEDNAEGQKSVFIN